MTLGAINIREIASSFLVLFAIIDIIGAIPIIIDMKKRGLQVDAAFVASISFAVLLAFLFAGEGILMLFGVDIQSFAIAGSIAIFIYGLEMTFGMKITHDDDIPGKAATIVPLVFPLIAGAGAMTTLVTLRAEYSTINIILGLALNMLAVFLVLKFLDKFEKIVGPAFIAILRKIFGVILLAISVKIFVTNMSILFA